MTLSQICDQLLEFHTKARELGEHEVAYHALAGVLHAGERLNDLRVIEEVERRAREHGTSLNADQPKHPLSEQSAASRGHQSIFEQLAITAAAAHARIRSEALIGKQKGRR